MIQKIAVIGGTGMLGKPVVSALHQSGFDITVLTRKINTQGLFPPGISIQHGDLRRKEDIRKFLTGQDAVFLNLSVRPEEKPTDFHTETDGLEVVLTEAKALNVKRIAFISSVVMHYQGHNNFQWWVFDVKKRAVEMIKNSGLPYTIFYPSTFMENFDGNYRRGNKMLLAGKSTQKMYFIAGEDYGRQVATSFKLNLTGNKEYTIQGPEAFTADEAVAEYIRYYTKEKLSVSRAPLGIIKFFGRFTRPMHYASHIIDALNNYPEKFEAANTWEELGKPTITIRQFAEQKSQGS